MRGKNFVTSVAAATPRNSKAAVAFRGRVGLETNRDTKRKRPASSLDGPSDGACNDDADADAETVGALLAGLTEEFAREAEDDECSYDSDEQRQLVGVY